MSGSNQIETIEIHHLVPGRNKVADKLLLRIVTPVYLGISAELGVRTENQIGACAGPFHLAGLAMATFENLFGIIGRIPGGVQVEQVREEVVGQRSRTVGED